MEIPAPAAAVVTAAPRRPIRPTLPGRWMDFFGALFPLPVYIPSALASYASIHLSVQALAHPGPLVVGWRSLAGGACMLLVALLMRVFDELKDAGTDLRLGRAGDPRYRDRPIVTGHVRLEDVRALRWAVVAALLLLNIALGFPWPFAAFAVLFALLWLSSRWFFWPAVKGNLLLAFATHNPLAAAVAAYAVGLSSAEAGVRPGLSTAWVVVASWLPLAAWETSRKVRLPEQETEYQTYSMMLGWRTAAVVPAVLAVGALAAHARVASLAGALWPFATAAVAGALPLLWACARLRLRPRVDRTRLQPYAEILITVLTVALPVCLALRHGIRFQ